MRTYRPVEEPGQSRLANLVISDDGFNYLGFRIAEVPEPAAAGLLLAGGLLVVRRRYARVKRL